MKKCNNCGSVYNDNVNFCATCGSASFSAFENNAQPMYNPVYNTNINANTIPNTSARIVNENGNVIAGVVGAFLFSLLGGVVYFLIYQLDIIAGISGLIIFVLANFGYNLFAKPSTKNSIVGLITSIIMTVIVIFLAEYCCVAYVIYTEVGQQLGKTFFDCFNVVPDYFDLIPELKDAFAEDLIFAYLFGAAATAGNVVAIIKARKNGQ